MFNAGKAEHVSFDRSSNVFAKGIMFGESALYKNKKASFKIIDLSAFLRENYMLPRKLVFQCALSHFFF